MIQLSKLGRCRLNKYVLFVCTSGLSILLAQGNPLAVLRYQQRDSNLFVSTLPVDSSTLGVADHHSRCCLEVLMLMLILVQNISKLLFHRWLLNPPSWHACLLGHSGIHQTLK